MRQLEHGELLSQRICEQGHEKARCQLSWNINLIYGLSLFNENKGAGEQQASVGG